LRNQGNDLASVGQALDRYPNLYVDIAARDYELGRQPRFAARFMERYKNRILFGTDYPQNKQMYEAWWRFLETTDDYLPGPTGWRIYALGLPDDVLRPVYRENARRLLNWK
jgi:predicted TIM-barrel fold metal-dependent hydrolase